MDASEIESLRQAADTDRQRALLDAIEQTETVKEAAQHVGVHERNAFAMLARLRKTAAKHGRAPGHWNDGVAPGYRMGKVTVQRSNGVIERVWERQHPENDLDALREAVQAFQDDIPRAAPVAAPNDTNADLLNLYVITDYHLGMLAWAEETGDDWDMTIAEDLLVRWFAQAIKQSPDAETAYFAQIGDFLHFDGLEAVTPESRHILDADTRFSKLVRVAIRALRRVIAMLLEKHQRVHILMADANHDPSSSVWLREFFAALYEQEPRISVELSPDTYYCHEHGQTSLFFHHGHKRKPTNIHSVFAAKFRDVFGRTKYSYGHMGHLHHIDVKENELMIVEQHRTLAANDAYASRVGWISGRSSSVITYSKRFGEVSRISISPDMVKAA